MYIRIISVWLIVSLVIAPLRVHHARATASPAVVMNELMWMGSSLSASDEWIELRNLTSSSVDLSDWLITKKSSGTEVPMLVIPTGASIAANGFFLIANYSDSSGSSTLNIVPDLIETDVSLVNTALQLKLYDSSGALIDTADDGSGLPLAGQYEPGAVWHSMERVALPGDGTVRESWRTASTSLNFDTGVPELGTPRAPNGNSAPVAEAGPDQTVVQDEPTAFDGSDSTDPDNDALAFAWSFGDGTTGQGSTPTHVYAAAGAYSVTLTVSDGELSASDTVSITVAAPEPAPTVPTNPVEEPVDEPPASPTQPGRSVNSNTNQSTQTGSANGDVLITELFPNPDGRDQDNEFIELYNRGSEPVALLGWQLTDGKRSISLTNIIIDSGDYLALPYATTKLLLRNSSGTITLLNPGGRTVDAIAYPETKAGQSFSRIGTAGNWEWSEKPTAGRPNESTATPVEAESVGAVAGSSDEAADESETAGAPTPKDVPADALDDLASRTLVKIRGVVTVSPGLFSTSTFWIEQDGIGVEISTTNLKAADYEINDQVEIVGRVSTAGITRRLNAVRDGVTVVGQDRDFEPGVRELGELTDADIGRLVQADGKVKSLTKTKFVLEDDSGDTLNVTLKRGTGLSTEGLAVGQAVSVTGLVGSSSASLQLWPRVESDLSVGDVTADDSPDMNVNATTALTTSPTKRTGAWPAVAAVAGFLVIGGWLFFRHRRQVRKDSDANPNVV